MVYIVHRNIRRLWSSTDDFPTLRFLNVSSQYSGRAMRTAFSFSGEGLFSRVALFLHAADINVANPLGHHDLDLGQRLGPGVEITALATGCHRPRPGNICPLRCVPAPRFGQRYGPQQMLGNARPALNESGLFGTNIPSIIKDLALVRPGRRGPRQRRCCNAKTEPAEVTFHT